jgi:hypothetical protein
MTETIYKYAVPLTDTFELELPASVGYCLFAEQHGELCVWIRLDPDAPKQKRTFHVRGTGHPLPEGLSLYHVGSCLFQRGVFVWHLFLDQGPLGAVTVRPLDNETTDA